MEKVKFTNGQKMLTSFIVGLSGHVVENPNSAPHQALESMTGSPSAAVLLAVILYFTAIGLAMPFTISQMRRLQGTQPLFPRKREPEE